MAYKEVVENFQGLIATLDAKKEPQITPNFESRRADSAWSLCENGKELPPLKFSNGKTQTDVINEVINAIKSGTKVVFIHGVCGTGKSAIALNIARELGRASIVVPVKALQRQYEEDYTDKKYVIKSNGKKLVISMITGRENHSSVIRPEVSCADPTLPDTVKITEKNWSIIQEYYRQNPLIKNKELRSLKGIKRVSIAPANPYWSPILSTKYELDLPDAKIKRYRGLEGNDFVFYHRKQGCGYYDQYQAYLDADVVIFNAAKYKIETIMNRKPLTDVDIIDEADEFLDELAERETLNITRLESALIYLETSFENEETLDIIKELLKLQEKHISAVGINENEIYELKDTSLYKVFKKFLECPEIVDDILIDETNYLVNALQIMRIFEPFLDETFVTYKRVDGDVIIDLISPNISSRFEEIVRKNNALVLMSGTLHKASILRDLFGVKDFKIVEAETRTPGTIEMVRTGKEFDCRYSNFKSEKNTREQYLMALGACWKKAKKPLLVHVNAFEDLPSIEETYQYNITQVMPKEQLKESQFNDKTGRLVSLFKSKLSDTLVTTKCSRGVDFPGDICNSMIFTKYPNPNPKDIFWKILKRVHPEYFWEVYKDKAKREFLQRLYRALRSPEDHIYVLSPDIRVLDAIKEIQTLYNKFI